MTEILLDYLPNYGLGVLALVIAAACFGVPLPASLLVLIAGTLIASDDLDALQTFFVCLGAAIVGDHMGYFAGRLMKNKALNSALPLVQRARAYLVKRGALAVFFTCWLFCPLSPMVNIAAGASGLPLHKFSIAEFLGEIIWVSLYLGLGFAFGSYVTQIADLAGNATAAMAFLLLAILAARMLWKGRSKPATPDTATVKTLDGEDAAG